MSTTTPEVCFEKTVNFECNVCGKKFTKFCSLQLHLRIHEGENLFSRNVFGKEFQEPNALKEHLDINESIGCPSKEAIAGSERSNKKISIPKCSLGENENSFKCSVCKKTFSRQDNLTRHGLIHSGKRPSKFK